MQQILWKLFFGTILAVSATAAVPQFRLPDTGGTIHTTAEWNGKQAILLFFVIHDCPIVNSYVPEMNRIAAAYAARGVSGYAVQADTSAPAAITAQYARDY